jgi:ABC-type Na+ transport system ATPase subunit NatA
VAAIEEKIARLAEDLALVGFLDRASGSLSAGQKTRVALAKALINDPELLLLDHVLRADLMLTELAIDSLLFGGAAFGFARLLASARLAGTLLQTGE